MHQRVRFACVLCAFAVSCSSSSSQDGPGVSTDGGHEAASSADTGSVADAGSTIDAFSGALTEHGTIVDYLSLKPVAGLTVTDNGASAVTDATGAFSLAVPSATTLTPQVTGPSYTHLLFPESVPAAADVDFGTLVTPDSSTYQIEQDGLSNDMSKALVQLVIVTAPSCSSAAGGTVSVVTPSGASVVYFAATGLPDGTVTSFQAVAAARPIAVIFNIDVGAALSLRITHPTCKQTPFPFTYQGKTYTGRVPTKATEPGDYNSATVMMLQ